MTTETVPTDHLIYRANHEHLRTVLFALLATHPELIDQTRDLFGQRPNASHDGITTTAPLAAFQPGWLYREPDLGDWFRIVEIDMPDPVSGNRKAVLELVLSTATPMSTAAFSATIEDSVDEPYTVKIPKGRL